MNYWLVIPAAGQGTRMQQTLPKQYLKIGSKTVLEHTLSRCLEFQHWSGIFVMVAKEDTHWKKLSLLHRDPIEIFFGDEDRYLTVLKALENLEGRAADEDWVLVHDAVRCLLTLGLIETLIKTVADDPVGGLLATPVVDTLKQADLEQHCLQTVDRSTLWAAQTPQMFRYGLLKKALLYAREKNIVVTDEAEALALLGHASRLVPGSRTNFKVTYHDDLALAAYYLEKK